jgi:hypothetical protein
MINMAKDTAIVKYKDNKIDGEIETLLEQTVTLTKDDFYKVAGKTVLSARALQWDANRKHISTRIIDWGSNMERAFAIVAGWVGDESKPKQYKEAIVELEFEVLRNTFILDKAVKSGWKINRDQYGRPSFEEEKHKAEMFSYMLRKKQFAVRECVTKAEAIVNRKLLSMEFREEEEIESEKEEINAVREQKAFQQRGHKRDTKPQAYGTYNNNGTVQEKKDPPRSTVVKQDDNRSSIIERAWINNLKTEKDKRDFLIAIHNNKEHSLHDRVLKLLNGQNILDLSEKKMDGIIGILKLEVK